MQSLDALVSRFSPDKLWRSTPASPEAIAQAEAALGVIFPPSYKAFLARYGAMSFIDVTISGVLDNGRDQDGGYVVTDTKRFRTEWRLPNHYVVIQPNYQAPYCLDTRKRDAAGECPAVCYEVVPARDSGAIACSFAEWVELFFVPSVE